MKQRYQAGISVPQVLVVLAVVLILATTFMGVVQFQLQRSKFEQATITAGYVAEIGFQQMRADLASANGNWSQIPGIVKDCESSDPYHARCQQVPKTSSFNEFRRVRENPADPNSPVIGIYEAMVETGEKRAIFGNKTITGSTAGFVKDSPTQTVGYDVYGNELCGGSITKGSCQNGQGPFVGVRVTAWLTDRNGNIPPKTRSQTVYGVLSLGEGMGEDGPSGYLLTADQEIIIQPNTDYKMIPDVNPSIPPTYQLEFTSGLFGPVHTNKNFKFVWVNKDVPTTNYQSDQLIMKRNQIGAEGVDGANNPFDIVTNSLQNRLYPYAGALQIETDKPWSLSYHGYVPGHHFIMEPFGHSGLLFWKGTQPAPNTFYRIHYKQSQPNGTPSLTQANPPGILRNYFKFDAERVPSPNQVDFVTVGENIQSVFQCTNPNSTSAICPISTVYTSNNDYDFFPDNVILWFSGGPQPARDKEFIVRPLAHNKAYIFDKLTYSGVAPVYRYSHKHRVLDPMDPVGGNASNRASHGHNNLDLRTLPNHEDEPIQVNLSPTAKDCITNGTEAWESCYRPLDLFDCVLSLDSEPCRWHVHDITVNGAATVAEIPKERNPFIQLAVDKNGDLILPKSETKVKEKPLLRPLSAGDPEGGTQNYLNQLEQLNKYLQLTLGMSMPRNEDGTLNPTTLPGKPNSEEEKNQQYSMGYSAGDATKSYPHADATEDFRAVYFGKKLKYSAGDSAGQPVLNEDSEDNKISDTAEIWVNDNPSPDSSGYMLVSKTKLSADYHRYTYRQIPPSQLILVRDKVVLIGNYRPATSDCSSLYADCHPYTATSAFDLGNATIVDGRLTIVSFTTNPPPVIATSPKYRYDYTPYNKGDIVVVGNVVYRNRFYQNPLALNEARQYDPQPSSPYTSASPSTINDPSIMWVTNVDGTLYREENEESPVGRHNSLGLFASNDVKIAVNAYYYGGSESTVPTSTSEKIRIMGQLVAGNRITISGRKNNGTLIDKWETSTVFSERDVLEVFGTLYSRDIPIFGDYFRRYRYNHYDKSLFVNPLIGAPYYPKVDGDYRNQSIFNNFPKLVNGSWRAGR